MRRQDVALNLAAVPAATVVDGALAAIG